MLPLVRRWVTLKMVSIRTMLAFTLISSIGHVLFYFLGSHKRSHSSSKRGHIHLSQAISFAAFTYPSNRSHIHLSQAVLVSSVRYCNTMWAMRPFTGTHGPSRPLFYDPSHPLFSPSLFYGPSHTLRPTPFLWLISHPPPHTLSSPFLWPIPHPLFYGSPHTLSSPILLPVPDPLLSSSILWLQSASQLSISSALLCSIFPPTVLPYWICFFHTHFS